jgi:hypothetical protein
LIHRHSSSIIGAELLVAACSADHTGHDVAACPFTSGSVRIDSSLVAGMPTDIALGRLGRACPDARLDTVGAGGTQAVALSLTAPGARVSAVQTRYDAYGDSIHSREPADLWVATGDSLRFPDGTVMPMTVSALRALDSTGVIVVDHGDDGTGSYVALCRYRFIAFIVSNVWPTLPDTGVVPLSRATPTDTARVWRIEVNPSPDPRIVAACNERSTPRSAVRTRWSARR